MMKFKKSIFASVSLLMLVFTPTQVSALCASGPLECIVFNDINKIVTPLPIVDFKTEASTLLAAGEGLLNDIASLTHLLKYIAKLQKLSLNPLSLAQFIEKTEVPEIESVVKGTQTIVDGFKGSVPGIKGSSVNFKNEKTTQEAINKAAIVANPTDISEEVAADERRRAFIQQALIDLHADILVAKSKLAELKESDSQSQNASSTGDSVGNSNIVIQMKSFENQVQALEENLASMRIVLEGIRNLRSGDMLKEDVGVGEKND